MRIEKTISVEVRNCQLRSLDPDLTNDPSSIENVALHFPHHEHEDQLETISRVQRCVLSDKSIPDFWYYVCVRAQHQRRTR